MLLWQTSHEQDMVIESGAALLNGSLYILFECEWQSQTLSTDLYSLVGFMVLIGMGTSQLNRGSERIGVIESLVKMQKD